LRSGPANCRPAPLFPCFLDGSTRTAFSGLDPAWLRLKSPRPGGVAHDAGVCCSASRRSKFICYPRYAQRKPSPRFLTSVKSQPMRPVMGPSGSNVGASLLAILGIDGHEQSRPQRANMVIKCRREQRTSVTPGIGAWITQAPVSDRAWTVNDVTDPAARLS